jgi:UTP--glucose-1-phosphate uridylyltransferase
MEIKKAVIMASGYGTRFLPVSKSVKKVMLPVLNRPVIDYVVDDCIAAGIEEIIISTKVDDKQIIDYYTEDLDLKKYLIRVRKEEKYKEIEVLHKKAKFIFMIQPDYLPYGTATPLHLAYDHIKDEDAIVYTSADDFIYRSDGGSEVKSMIDAYNKSGADALASFTEVPKEFVYKYGVAKYIEEGGWKWLKELIEKPKVEDAPSNFINISKYIFKPEVAKMIDGQMINGQYNELLITDTISEYIDMKKKVLLYENTGEFVDCGDVPRWLKTNLRLAKDNPALWADIEAYMKTLSTVIK